MSKFLTGPALEKEICNVILDGKETLLIVSPYIKLDAFFVDHFKRQVGNSQLHLLIVFGKE